MPVTYLYSNRGRQRAKGERRETRKRMERTGKGNRLARNLQKDLLRA
jgi:hypothetical protein